MRSRIVYAVDRTIGSWIEKTPRFMQPFFERLSAATHPVVWGVVLGIIGLVVWGAGNAPFALVCFLTIALLPIEQLLKRIFRRNRPETMYVDNMKFRSYSFPSGHAYASVLMLGLFYAGIYTLIDSWLALVLGGIGIGGALAIGISRVYLGAHFPTDVIAGWAIGAGVVFCMVIFGVFSFGIL